MISTESWRTCGKSVTKYPLNFILVPKSSRKSGKELENKRVDFSSRAKLDDSMGRIKEAVGSLGSEVREGYLRIKKALDSNSQFEE